MICDDGVNFLRRTSIKYDAIISDAKSRAAHAGNSMFFSIEYYDLCHEHLASDGLMVQWIPLNVPPEELRIIVRTFNKSFSHSYIWLDPTSSCLLVGVNEPLAIDLGHVEREISKPWLANLRRAVAGGGHGFD